MRFIKLFTALLVACFAAYLWLAPGYIDITVPVARHQGGMGFWWESHRTELAYADSRGVLYVHRQVGTTSNVHAEHWKTEADIFAHFDERLARLGWTAGVAGISEPPAPESYLLGANGTKQYYRTDTRERSSVFVSVWPVRGMDDRFNVALTTANPSLWRRITDALDD